MKKTSLVLLSLLTLNINAFYLRCQGPGDTQVFVSGASRDVVETETSISIEETLLEFTNSKNSQKLSGWGSIVIEKTGLATFTGKDFQFSYIPYNSVHGDLNLLKIGDELIFENISMSCSAKL